jgi:ERF superfamily
MGTIRTSETIKELSTALVKAQKKFGAAIKNAENPAYKRGANLAKYADLSAVIEAILEHLNDEGLAVMQHPSLDPDEKVLTVTTRLQHESGEWMESEFSVPAQMLQRYDAQTVGSATTYACRYALQAIFVVPREDDDGNAASGIGSKEAAQEVAKRKVEEHKAHQKGEPPQRKGKISYMVKADGTLLVYPPDANSASAIQNVCGGIYLDRAHCWAVPGDKLDVLEEMNDFGYTVERTGGAGVTTPPGEKKAEPATEATASSPPTASDVAGNMPPRIEEVKQKKTRNGKTYWSVKYGGVNYSVWDTKVAAHLAAAIGKPADLQVQKNDKYQNIVGIHSINGREFQDNEPVRKPDDLPGEDLFL